MSMLKCLPMQQIHSKPQPAFPSKATSGQQYYSAIYDYTAADVDEVSFVESKLPYSSSPLPL